MVMLEEICMFQRMAGSLKTDIAEGKGQRAIGKVELLEGELNVMRQLLEAQLKEEQEKKDEIKEESAEKAEIEMVE